MEQYTVYHISTGNRIMYGIFAALLFGVTIFFLTIHAEEPALYLIPFLSFTGGVLILINIVKRRVIISDISITNLNVFIKKELLFNGIKGCRIGQKLIILESNSGGKLTIGNYIDLEDSSELLNWIKDNFKDLDAIDLKHDEESFLQDTSLGYTVEDREKKLKTAKQISLAYNIVGAAAFGLVFLGRGYPIVIIGLFYPLLGIIIMKFSKGLIKFAGNSKRSITPFLLLGFMIPIIIMLIVVMSDYQIFKFYNLWLQIGVVAIMLSAALYFIGLNRAIGGIKAQIIMMIIFSVIYGFGSIISINCAFDRSTPTIYKAEVLDHKIESGKHTSYLLTLTKWAPMHEQKEEDVGKYLYNRVSIGDTVKIYFKPGLLKAPWYQVGQ